MMTIYQAQSKEDLENANTVKELKVFGRRIMLKNMIICY